MADLEFDGAHGGPVRSGAWVDGWVVAVTDLEFDGTHGGNVRSGAWGAGGVPGWRKNAAMGGAVSVRVLSLGG